MEPVERVEGKAAGKKAGAQDHAGEEGRGDGKDEHSMLQPKVKVHAGDGRHRLISL